MPEVTTLTGHCYCGGLRFEVELDPANPPMFTAYCHCDSCRRAHAAPLYHVACVARSQFRITAGADLLNEFCKPGGTITRAFCSVCGARVLNRFGSWRPGGKEPLAFFPNLLADGSQTPMPELLRPRKTANAGDCVLEQAFLQDFFNSCG